MSDILAPIKCMTREELTRFYPVNAKWPKPTISGRMAVALELIKYHPSIFDAGDFFQDAIDFGSAIMKTTVFPDGSIVMYPINYRTEQFFESEYDHGNGD